jgi:hypothetical protein
MSPKFLLAPLLLCSCLARGQAIDVAYKYGIDTTIPRMKNERNIIPYFSAGIKYPESSVSLAQRANKALSASGQHSRENGFITFRFGVTPAGKMVAFQLYMTDKQYQPAMFSEGIVKTLYAFTQSLKEWPAATYQKEPAVYVYYLSYQIKNGLVLTVAP